MGSYLKWPVRTIWGVYWQYHRNVITSSL